MDTHKQKGVAVQVHEAKLIEKDVRFQVTTR
jgi:hypothetical protein